MKNRGGRPSPLDDPDVAMMACEAYAEGECLEGVARRFGSSKERLKIAMYNNGFEIRSPGVPRKPKKPMPKVASIDPDKAAELLNQGFHEEIVAAEFGVSRSWLKKVVRRAGYKTLLVKVAPEGIEPPSHDV